MTWGSGDATQAYTIYDGNYLNWKETPVTESIPKIDIMKAVTKNLMNAIEDVNVGVMRFTGSDGGRVLHAISPLNTDRAAILAKINGLADGGATPLAEALYESALYWRGLNADYGNLQLEDRHAKPQFRASDRRYRSESICRRGAGRLPEPFDAGLYTQFQRVAQ